jgi:DNA-directed RNA polymerase subunit RPC12/RpoP
MTLEPITCNNCGAALDVPPEANYVTCAYCASRLAVKRTSSVVYTEVLQELDARTQRMAADLGRLQLQSELERIDHEWEQQRQPYLLRDRTTGATFEPGGPLTALSVVMTALASTLLGFFIVVWSVVFRSDYSPAFLLLAFLALGLIVWATVARIRKLSRYQRAKSAYEARRAAIVQRVLDR